MDLAAVGGGIASEGGSSRNSMAGSIISSSITLPRMVFLAVVLGAGRSFKV